MPLKKRLTLGTLTVKSFITSEESRKVKGMTMLATLCADTDCASIQPRNLCEAPIEYTQACTPTCATNCGTCVTCGVSCNGSCTAPCTYSATAMDQLCFDCTQ